MCGLDAGACVALGPGRIGKEQLPDPGSHDTKIPQAWSEYRDYMRMQK